ncbi:hypothetical protein EYF80_013241 [Liparis tanakae]|uniref:Uncharacterized protein n=1 Tax=Liparis tanakae TaxID=230148 RepID=A0A4Z2IFN6_9TELE|nr:hypothetical protein EYF80_013241 [Liparis tanakae]
MGKNPALEGQLSLQSEGDRLTQVDPSHTGSLSSPSHQSAETVSSLRCSMTLGRGYTPDGPLEGKKDPHGAALQ